MSSVNTIWSLLYDDDTMFEGDWIRARISIPSFSRKARDMSRALITSRDPYIRGWLTEAAVQCSLKSRQRDYLTEADPTNTYEDPLEGRYTYFYVKEGWAIIPNKIQHSIDTYHQEASVAVDPDTLEYAVRMANGALVRRIGSTNEGPSLEREESTITGIPFAVDEKTNKFTTVTVTIPPDAGKYRAPDAQHEGLHKVLNGGVVFPVSACLLPSLPAVTYLREGIERISSRYNIQIPEDNPVEQIGAVVAEIVREGLK